MDEITAYEEFKKETNRLFKRDSEAAISEWEQGEAWEGIKESYRYLATDVIERVEKGGLENMGWADEAGKAFSGDYKYVKFEEGKPVEGIFRGGVSKISEKFQRDGQPVKGVEYTLEIDEKEKTFFSTSYKLFEKMKNVTLGRKISITRYGSGTKTDFDVRIL